MKIWRFNELADFSEWRDLVGGGIRIVKDRLAYTEKLHMHDYYEIEYVSEGRGVQVINGIPYPVESGSVVFLNTTDAHSYYSLKDMAVYNCCFTNKELLRYFPSQSLQSPVVNLNSYFQLQLEQLFYLLESELRTKNQQYQEAAWMLLDLVLLAISRNESNPVTPNSFWSPLLTEIAVNYKTITLADAIRITDVSERHFFRLFKRDFLTTFHEYLTAIRIQQAKYRLVYSRQSIAEICEAVGYGSPCSFFTDFKRIVGTTPLKYRKDCQNSFANYNVDTQSSFLKV